MNRCPPNVWNAVKKATALLERERIRYALIGTAALAALGVEVEVPDADLLVESDPEVLPSELFLVTGGSVEDRLSIEVDGVKVDYVLADDIGAEKYLDLDTVGVDGVHVATAAVVMSIKADAGRPKDVEHAKALAEQISGVA